MVLEKKMSPLAQAMATIGANEQLRKQFLSLIREAEKSLARQDFSVRDEVTGVIIDALHEGVGPLKKRLSSGIEFYFYYRSKIARDFVMSPESEPDHVWEPQTTKLLLYLGKSAKTVIIGGAYSGDQAILLAHAMREKEGTCHCFEPNSDQIEMLQFNAKNNGLKNLIFNQMGLWSSDQDHLILIGDDSFAHPEIAHSPNDPGAFPTTTIDTYGRKLGIDKIDLIMLDIEGAELNALQGAQHYLSQPASTSPQIIFEIHRSYMDWSKGLANTEIVKFLRNYNYSVFSIRDYQSNMPMRNQPIEIIRPEDTYIEGPPHGFNMLAIKDERILDSEIFRFCHGVSPKLLTHRDPKLHQPYPH